VLQYAINDPLYQLLHREALRKRLGLQGGFHVIGSSRISVMVFVLPGYRFKDKAVSLFVTHSRYRVICEVLEKLGWIFKVPALSFRAGEQV
jgi:hypothetical protein